MSLLIWDRILTTPSLDLALRRRGLTQRGSDRLAIVVRSHVVAQMEYEREGDLRSESKREYLVLGSQESWRIGKKRSLMRRLILDYIEEIGM